MPNTSINKAIAELRQAIAEDHQFLVNRRGAIKALAEQKSEISSDPVFATPKKTDLAEAYVLLNPGVTTAQVAARIDQPTPTAESTLRQVMARRHSIVRYSSGRWYPSGTRAKARVRTEKAKPALPLAA